MTIFDANIQAIGKEAQNKLRNYRVSFTTSNLVTDFATMQLQGLGIQHIQMHNAREKSLLNNIPRVRTTTIETLGSFVPYLLEEFEPSHIFTESTLGVKSHNIKWNQAHHNASPTEALIAGTLYAEYIRHTCAPYQNERQFEDINLQSLITPTARIYDKKHKHALLIGAGGIGTYVGILHALEDTKKLTIIDYDSIESSNLNRQILYANDVGKPKAKVLSERINALAQRQFAQGENYKVTSESNLAKIIEDEKIDSVFCCTDNQNSRYITSVACEKTQTTLIEGACNTKAALACKYEPTKTSPIHELRNITYQEVDENQTSCSEQANPSIVIPNAMAAGLMMFASKYHLDVQNASQHPQGFLTYDSLNKKIQQVT